MNKDIIAIRQIAKEAIAEINGLDLWYPSGAGKDVRRCEMYNDIMKGWNVEYGICSLAEQTLSKYDEDITDMELKYGADWVYSHLFKYVAKRV